MLYTIVTDCCQPAAHYAQAELIRCLAAYSAGQPALGREADWQFDLSVDTALAPHQYHIKGAAKRVKLTGGSASALLGATYEALRRMGMVFDLQSERAGGFSPAKLAGVDALITPFARLRGVRQHINFPMDISAYTLADAKAYIRSLARLGMNAITFHSYTGQWHGHRASAIVAGHFFYGQIHPVPKALEHCVDNRKLYAIPEIEPILYDDQARDAWARYWLREVIACAQTVGMAVTLSVELLPPKAGENGAADTDRQLDMLRELVASYPAIDCLEVITPEGGGQGPALTLAALPERAQTLFGVSQLPYVPQTLPDALAGGLQNVKRGLDVWHRRAEVTDKPMALGMYIMCKETVKTLLGILRQALPQQVPITLLPAHGAMAVRDNVAFYGLDQQDWQRIMVYSWAEFDGNMYLLQNSAPGVEALMDLARQQSPQGIHGVCLNHWRTAENAVTLSYGAKAMAVAQDVQAFYRQYALDCGIIHQDRFALAMAALGELDTFNRDNLFNIGFCFLGCWMAPGLSWVRGWTVEHMDQAIEAYSRLAGEFAACLAGAILPQGRGLLRMLMNRCQCSIRQIQAVRPLKLLSAHVKDDALGQLMGITLAEALVLCDQAEDFSRQYIEIHTACLPDRGCQGTAVSYMATISVYIQHIRACVVEGKGDCPHNPPDFDAPPPPDTAFLR